MNIARWDGSAWSALGAGFGNFVTGITFAPDGSLVVTGNGQVSNVPQTWGLARWDGSAWSAIGGGTQRILSTAVFLGDDLLVGGDFRGMGFDTDVEQTMAHIGRWDGAQWTTFDPREPSARPDGLVSAGIATPDGQLYVSGHFRHEGARTMMVRWTGQGWATVDMPYPSPPNLRAVGPDGALYGTFNTLDELDAPMRVVRFDGQNWTELGQGLQAGSVLALAVGANGQVAVATYDYDVEAQRRVSVWNGSSWQLLPGTFSGGTVAAVAVRATGEVVVGGSFVTIDGEPALRLAAYSEGVWQEVGGGLPSGFVDRLVLHPNGDLYVGGSYLLPAVDPNQSVRLARWDGSAWSGLGLQQEDEVSGTSMTIDVKGRVFATGSVALGGVAMYDGTSWTRFGVGGTAGFTSLAVADDHLWVFGSFTAITSTVLSGGIARWDGFTVSAEPTAASASPLTVLSPYPNPFSDAVRVRFELAQSAPVTIAVYDVLGRRVALLSEDAAYPAGQHEIVWRAGAQASGPYFVRFSSNGAVQTVRTALTR